MRKLFVASSLILLLIAVLVFMAVGDQVVTDGLVSFWTFDKSDVNGTTAKDVWGNNDGTIVGDLKEAEGKIREALEFDGADGRVDCGNDASLSITDAITIEAWLYPRSMGESSYPRVLTKGDNPYEIDYLGDKNLGFELRDAGGTKHALFSSIGSVPLNQWTHCVLLYDGAVQKIYINGEQDPNILEWASKIGTTDNPLYIGNRADMERTFDGFIDDVRIYNKALSEEEVEQNYAATSRLAVVEPANKLAITWGVIKTK